MNTLKYWVALSRVQRLGPKLFGQLLAKFGAPEAVFNASVDELCSVPRLSQRMAEEILGCDIEAVATELQLLNEEEVKVITLEDSEYPSNLKQISDAPPVLFKRGNFRPEDEQAVAIVGTRRPTPQGLDCARRLAIGLAQRGFTIASGLALGIDTAAHEGALEAGGRTIAVLGSGIRVVHPRRNGELALMITYNGAVISELHPNAPPSPANLMYRDRITSGLALGTIIVEAKTDSGTMDTANRTRKQNRLLFAVENKSEGNVRLLKVGAIPIPEEDIDMDKIAEKLMADTKSEQNEDGQLELF